MSPAAAMEQAGQAGAPAIVFLHGATFNRQQWRPQVQALAATCRVVAPDLPGHGTCAEQPFSLESAEQAVAGAIHDATTGAALLVGLSLGGYVALRHADRHPQQVSGLVLAGSCVQYTGWLRLAAALNVRALEWRSQAGFARRQAAWLRRRVPPSLAEPVIAAGLSLRGGREAMRALLGLDVGALLARCAVPVLVVNGEHDALNRRAGHRLVRLGGALRQETILGAGHLSNLERPEAFTSSVRQWMASVA